MRQVVAGAQITLDGVMQAPGAPEEDPSGRFAYAGWAVPHFGGVLGEAAEDGFTKPFDLLLGRETYEIRRALAPTTRVGARPEDAWRFTDCGAHGIASGGSTPRRRSRGEHRCWECLDLAPGLGSRHGRLEALVADLSTSTGIEALRARADELEVDLLVDNAGAASYGRFAFAFAFAFASASAERERGLMRLNVEAIAALTRGLLPQLLDRGRGGIIYVASQMAFQPMPFASYAASKAFVLSFSEAEVAGSREPERRVPHLHPGAWSSPRFVRTSVVARSRSSVPSIASLTFAGRFAPRADLRRTMAAHCGRLPTLEQTLVPIRRHESGRDRLRASELDDPLRLAIARSAKALLHMTT